MPTVAQQIEGVERHIQNCEERLDAIERSLRLSCCTQKERDDLETEEKGLETKLSKHRNELKDLRKENLKTMGVSTVLLAFAFALYFIFWNS